MEPGNKYVLRYRNLLPFEPASIEHNVFKDPNVSNLHTHGLHISGESPSDDVTRFFEGGHGGDFVYDIPVDHMGGTYWYHAHHHGSTFLQVSSGAFGQMLVDDSNDGVPANVAAMTERQLVVAFLDPSVAGTGGDTLISGTLDPTWTVNGTVQGNLCTTANEWQHWRVLLADRQATEKTLGVGANCEVALLARDGVWRTTAPLALPTRSISLTGASRADFAVRCTDDSVITIGGATIANILVFGDGNTTVGPLSNGSTGSPWSATRPQYLRDLQSAPTVHAETIHMGARTVNGAKFDGDVPNLTLPATDVQQWTLAGNSQHPFHLHVYHVQAQNCSGSYENGEYYDVVADPCAVRFDLNAATSNVFEGRTILHCHILEHEDQGAMGWLDVIGGLPPPSFPADTTIIGTYGETYAEGSPAWCSEDANCSDANVCDGVATCNTATGTCLAGAPLTCDDANVCTADACDPATGCSSVALPDGQPCGDANVCNGTESCQGGSCAAGTALSCDDANVCTADACDPATGCSSVALPDGQPCGDANVCNGTESCQGGSCAAGTPLACDDGNACTIDSCDPSAGCTHTPTTCSAPPTCSYDSVSGTITITMNSLAGVLTVASGNIKLGTTICGTLTTTDTIVVNGTGLITIRGDYVPGRTAEPTGVSEIEFVINTNKLTFDASVGDDTIIIVPSGADLGGDGDQDITMSGTQTLVKYMGGTGNDVLDASAYSSKLTLFGGAGADHLIGGSGADSLYGDADADILEGNNGNDMLWGGAGNDVVRGGAGNDTFNEDKTANGTDSFDGGAGVDTLSYAARIQPVSVTLDDGIANEGEVAEGDSTIGIERVTGGTSDDTLVGDALVNLLRGGGGNDTIFGRGAADTIFGDAGNDFIDGETGGDTMYGGIGNDTLVGDAASTDRFIGNAGDDTIVDNTDGRIETVDCGDGIDTAESNSEDTFTACENLTPP
jgi:FtsP/CotA-like multicopper oxidase with cupredoxin domain/Ca2+-binding RTX toxin-like protein